MSRPSFTDDEALAFHAGDKPGKLEVVPTKPMATQRDLSLAYSPGVAVPVLAIAKDPELAYEYTSKGNLVAVISRPRLQQSRWARSWRDRAGTVPLGPSSRACVVVTAVPPR